MATALKNLICYLNLQNLRKILLDRFSHIRLIHGINVDVLYVVSYEVDDLLCGVNDSCLLHSLRVVAELINYFLEAGWYSGSGKCNGTTKLLCIGDRHYSCKYRYADVVFAESVKEVEEFGIVKEHLSGEEINTGIDLELQVLNVFVLVSTLNMTFRIAGAADAEISVGLYVCNKL